MIYNYHIFFALKSCRQQYMTTSMIQLPGLELSLAGLNFHSRVFVSHRYRLQLSLVLYYAIFLYFLSQTFVCGFFFQNLCQIFKHC